VDAVGLIAGSGWASGLNLYLVTLVLGMAGRFGWSDVPEVLTRTDVLITAAVLFFIEFAADKIPYLDNLWDALHTVVRPLGAAALGYVIAGDSGSIGQAMGALVAGALATTSHAAKATTRAAVNTSPEPVSNLTLSVLEDIVASGMTVLAIALPVVALVVAILLAVGSVWTGTKLWRAVRRLMERRRAQADASGG
jgi:hypothetical protein